MGLAVSHDCWSGDYSAFMRWRRKLCEVAGLPPLELMEGFFNAGEPGGNPCWKQHAEDLASGLAKDSNSIWNQLPIKWECLKPSALHELLYHSDCDGEIPWKKCGALADALEELIPKLPPGDGVGHIGDWTAKTKQFVDGLRTAHKAKENVEFH